MCEICTELLNEALNLATRSDQFEEQRRREAQLSASRDGDAWLDSGRFDQHVERHNLVNPHQRIAPRSMTMHLWLMDQYDRDLASWQARARHHLMQGCAKIAQEGQP